MQKTVNHQLIYYRPCNIEIYRQFDKKYNYQIISTEKLNIDSIAYLLEPLLQKSVKIRINKTNTALLRQGNPQQAFEHYYFDLNEERKAINRDYLLAILKEVIYNPDLKLSIELFWGISPQRDAIYSSKLTYFKNQFTFFSDYRLFIGEENKSPWLSELMQFDPFLKEAELEFDPQLEEETVVASKPDTLQTKITASKIAKDTVKVSLSQALPKYLLSYYSLNENQYQESSDSLIDSLNLASFLDSLSYKYPKLLFRSYDYSTSQEKLKVFDAANNLDIANLILSSSHPYTKISLEWIVDFHYQQKRKYKAHVLTVFDNQFTFLEDYQKSVSKKDYQKYFNFFERIKKR